MIDITRPRSQLALVGSIVAISVLLSGCASSSPPQAQQQLSLGTARSEAAPGAGFYRVTEGDTLASISAAFGHDATEVANWNARAVNAPLRQGDVLRVGPPSAEIGGLPSPAQKAVSATTCDSSMLTWPVKGRVVSRFGESGAKAITIAGETGDTVRAAESGRVVYTGNRINGYGLLVIVKHNDHYITAYGYNQTVLVKEGNDIKKGQPIALMGGASGQQPSLLFELRKDRQPVDPVPYLSDCAS